MTWDEQSIKAFLQEVIAANPGKTLGISVSGRESSSTRFSNNAIATNGSYGQLDVAVTVSLGQKQGTSMVNQLDRAKVKEAIERAEALARVVPENPESMPPLGPQRYPKVPQLFFPATAESRPDRKAEAIASVVDKAKQAHLTAAGFFETAGRFSAHMNSAGLFYYFASSRAYYSNTFRGADGGSGWASADAEDIDKLGVASLAESALDKALRSRNPKPLPAGKYTVVLEPAAVADLVFFLLYGFTAREADEGSTFLSVGDGKNRLGERLVSPRITMRTDPAFPELPVVPVGSEELPQTSTAWIEKGIVRNLIYTRYWAKKQGKHPLPFPANLIMAGENNSVEELIRSTKRGVLISRFWYIRTLNPMLLLLTGLTRDGVFLIENGKVRHPVNNFRFNESPVTALRNIEMISRPTRAVGGEMGFSAYVPALKVKGFNFASVSDAV
jgi:predicted Zn-dependent protease